MSKKKGLSADEKRTKMLEIFYEKKEFFQLKDLEKIAPKEKGITPMSVKDVLKSLVDDDLVDTDKIGTSTYFWAYPNKRFVTKSENLKRLKEQNAQFMEKVEKNKQILEKARMEKKTSDERSELITTYSQLTARKEDLSKKLDEFGDSNPEYLQKLSTDSQKLKDASNRWTDNVFALINFCDKMNVEKATIYKHFKIPEDLDYI